MEHVNGWCFRGIYKGGLWENDLHVSARKVLVIWLMCVRNAVWCRKFVIAQLGAHISKCSALCFICGWCCCQWVWWHSPRPRIPPHQFDLGAFWKIFEQEINTKWREKREKIKWKDHEVNEKLHTGIRTAIPDYKVFDLNHHAIYRIVQMVLFFRVVIKYTCASCFQQCADLV